MQPEIKDTDWEEAEAAVRAYGCARKAFRAEEIRLKLSGLLSGNDNKVGIAGEFWAKKLYSNGGWKIVEVFPSNNEGCDFSCRRGRILNLVSVKVISDESKKGRQMSVKAGSTWDELCLLLLDDGLIPYRYGLASKDQYRKAQQDKAIGPAPNVARTWVGPKGWMSRYGEVENWR